MQWAALVVINARGGDVIGQSQTAGNTASHAFLWENGSITDLGTLGGRDSFASGINERGDVVGQSQTAGNAANHAVLWER